MSKQTEIKVGDKVKIQVPKTEWPYAKAVNVQVIKDHMDGRYDVAWIEDHADFSAEHMATRQREDIIR